MIKAAVRDTALLANHKPSPDHRYVAIDLDRGISDAFLEFTAGLDPLGKLRPALLSHGAAIAKTRRRNASIRIDML